MASSILPELHQPVDEDAIHYCQVDVKACGGLKRNICYMTNFWPHPWYNRATEFKSCRANGDHKYKAGEKPREHHLDQN
jgi:hypothetical protein